MSQQRKSDEDRTYRIAHELILPVVRVWEACWLNGTPAEEFLHAAPKNNVNF